jgi:predicted phosphodiesterase
MEKLGVIADIHGNALALAAVVRDARLRGVERFVDLGDILYGPLRPIETYRMFRGLPMVAGVRGNQDRKIFEAEAADLAANRNLAFAIDDLGAEPVAWLRTLPATATIGSELFLCHGTPASDTTYLLEDVCSGQPVVRPEGEIAELLGGVRAPVVLCGHSHVPRVVQLSNGQMIVNPGSVGLPAYEDDTPVKHFMETYSPHSSYAILEKRSEKGKVSFGVSLHRVVYDWREAAAQARRLQAEDWARGIESGRMVIPLREQSCVP